MTPWLSGFVSQACRSKAQALENKSEAFEVGNVLDGFSLSVSFRLLFSLRKGFLYGFIGRIRLQISPVYNGLFHIKELHVSRA
ncbi:MAG: hypothetical protein MR720_04890 [Sutterella sp.]|nr:hypothetical protein [Sutterella sp.]